MNTLVNVKTSLNMVEDSERYDKIAKELEEKGYKRESQNVRRAVESLEKAGTRLFDRYEPETVKKRRERLKIKKREMRMVKAKKAS